jgi:hypothetical protein
MIAVGSHTTITAHCTGSVVVEVTALEHSSSTSGIVAEKMDTRAPHLQWHLRSVHLWESEELARLGEAVPNIAHEMAVSACHLSPFS